MMMMMMMMMMIATTIIIIIVIIIIIIIIIINFYIILLLLLLFPRGACSGGVIPLLPQPLPCQEPSVLGSALRQVGPVFVYPRYNKADPYYLLTRREQVTVFRFRTGHNRHNYHLFSKLRIGHTEQCPCGTGSQTTEHLLQSCPIYEPLRKGIWPDHTPEACELYGSLGDLLCTATFIEETGVSI